MRENPLSNLKARLKGADSGGLHFILCKEHDL